VWARRERERERERVEDFLGFRGYVPPVVPNNLSNGVPNLFFHVFFFFFFQSLQVRWMDGLPFVLVVYMATFFFCGGASDSKLAIQI
jgi:hypothetical protein